MRRNQVICAAVLLFGCAKLEKEKLPVITTAGPHALEAGKTLKITATTANGADTGYLFESAAPAVATVDATGLVTGVKAGETTIEVRGAQSGAVANHAIVVIDAVTAPPPPPSGGDVASLIPYYEKWMSSAHADKTAVPFNNWNAQGSIHVDCARCHSMNGFIDYLGGDGSAAGQVDKPAPTGTVVNCKTCHNPAADALTTVTFPSGAKIEGLGGEARCMTCHQGRASGKDVDTAIKNAMVTDDDTPNPMLKFTNVHYFPAAATLFASRAGGGYQYAGQTYDARFRHVPGLDKCTGCHDQHSLKVKFDLCATCHQGVTDRDSARKIRMMSSATRDYDGDGDLSEGIYGELDGLRSKLLAAIVGYGKEKKTPVCYSAEAYPYWFVDKDGDGMCSADEAKAANGFASWTARLARAAYNYQLSVKDPGNFAHNAKYIIELLFDSVTDVNKALTAKVDMAKAVRTDFGHFDGTSEAARHWDQNEKVDATCSRCHAGSSGFVFYQTYGVSTEVPDSANGLDCATCHSSFGTEFAVRAIAQTSFPSGVTLKLMGNDNLCSSCHAGREAKATIDVALKTAPRFLNVHYLPAGSTKLGSQVHLGYEYDGQTYAGPLMHTGGSQCTSCHDPVATKHTFKIEDAFDTRCQTCHADANGDPRAIRNKHKVDYDGDGNTSEPLAEEINGMAAKLLAAMQTKAPLCYGPGAYPYFFKDTDGDGKCSAAETVSTNGFAPWTADLVKAAHNYQISRVEPGAWAHNFDYMGQLLYDSTVQLRGDGAGMVRP